MLKRDWELMSHGIYNTRYHWDFTPEEERAAMQESREIHRRFVGTEQAGWFSPAVTNTLNTFDLLAEAGFTYCLDWPADDQPFWMRSRAGRMLSVPYSVELNDSPAMVMRHHTGREFADMITDQFDEMLEQSAERPMVMTIILHPFILGQPHRLRPLRGALRHILGQRDNLWITRPGEMFDYVASLPEGLIP
jgi:peptidoglycan/xylan/chitin deacetylase (PgdA/CDA1 family)